MTIYPIEKTESGIRIDNAVKLTGIGKKYPFERKKDIYADDLADFWALKDISLEVEKGGILGIIGRNGAGKTTLLNIIAGILSPTQGHVYAEGRALGLFNLGIGFQDELTGKENIFLNGAILGATRKELEDKLALIIEFSELGEFINMPLGTYSQGMRLRLAFSIIANLDFDILVIDEVLAVGDALFQSKCFQRLMDFKRAGKTLIITSQGMELVERFCDKIALIDHGSLLFSGNVKEGIDRYLALLNTDAFFVGPEKKQKQLFNNTKKWTDNIVDWGKKFGTKEVEIESVEFINKFGWKSNRIKSGSPLKIKVNFKAKNIVKDPHFGVAIFRNDGVYCYGPNTSFDGYRIPELREGRGFVLLNYHKILLAPGKYRVSVAVWDKNETLAFDYHFGLYSLIVNENSNFIGNLLNIPYKLNLEKNRLFLPKQRKLSFQLISKNNKSDRCINSEKIKIKSIKFLNALGEEIQHFLTNDSVKIIIDFHEIKGETSNWYFWLGIYRDDGVYCQGIMQQMDKNKNFNVIFPELPLLPGGYKVSVGIWDDSVHGFLIWHPEFYKFNMFFNRQDHGTIYLKHSWKWKLP